MSVKISDSEWTVMQVIWSHSPVTAEEVIELIDREDWSPRTVKTLLHRLVEKKAIRFKLQGKRYVYSPRIAREACQTREGRAFLERVFNGEPSSLLAHFVRTSKLSAEDIDELRRLLEEGDTR